MTNVVQFFDYKKKHIMKNELKDILMYIDAFELSMQMYNNYSEVQEILNDVQEHKRVLKESLSKFNNGGE